MQASRRADQSNKVVEEERKLEQMQKDLVELVSGPSNLDEENLVLWRKVSVVPEPEAKDENSDSRLLLVNGSKHASTCGEKVKLLPDS